MKRLLFSVLCILAAVASYGQDREQFLVANYDLDGAAADANAVVTAAAAADSTTYAIAAQPDTPRPLILTIVDADSSISAGTITVTGADSAGTALTIVHTYAGAGSTTVTSTTNFATVTSVISSVLTGEGAGDTVALGTTATLPVTYCALVGQGNLVFGAPNNGAGHIKTSGSSTTVVPYTALSGALAGLAVGDLMQINLNGTITTRTVTAVASVNSITIDSAISTTDATYRYLRHRCGTTSTEGWVPVATYKDAFFTVDVAQMNGTGGIVATLRCRAAGEIMTPASVWTQTFSAAGVASFIVQAPYHSCRIGLNWGTNDDGTDTTTAKEVISVYFRGVTR
jgi:hypothetical protein